MMHDATDEDFIALLGAYRASGGVARDTELAVRMALAQPTAFARFARHFADEALVFFRWNDVLWFPWFQFDRRDMSLLPGPARVAVELAGWMQPWERTGWFVRPHVALHERAPVNLVCAEPRAVVEAARLERFVQTA